MAKQSSRLQDLDPREAEQHKARFHLDYGKDGQFESDVLRACIEATHTFLSEIGGHAAADAAVDAFVERVFGERCTRGAWRDQLDEHESEIFSSCAMGQVFHDLNAYAHEGIALTSEPDVEEREAYIHGLIKAAEQFEKLVPFREWSIKGGDLSRTLMLARGRWALDHGQPIEPPALAAFGGVTERRIRNMMSRTEALFSPKDGGVPADQALDWLRSRPKYFRPSFWTVQKPDEPWEVQPGRLDDVLFVPVGADGSVFHPALKRDGHFLLGAEAEDHLVADYHEALVELQAMVTPVWRRPTASARWTRVRGVRWERMTMGELQATTSSAEGSEPEDPLT